MTLKAKFFFCIKLKQNKMVSQVQTELIHLFLLLFPFSAAGGPAEERLLVSQINSCVVSEALARQPETNPNTPASGLMLCFCGSHGGPDTQIHHWSSHLWRLWSGILLKGTKPKLGMEPPIFQTVAHQLYLKEPRSECFGKREKENSQISHNYRLNVTAADYVSSCLSHYLLFVSSVSISLQTQSQSNLRTSCQKLSYGRSIFNKNESYMIYLTCCTFRQASEHETPRHNVRAPSLQPGQMKE